MIPDYNEHVIFLGIKLSIAFLLTNQFVMVLRLFQTNKCDVFLLTEALREFYSGLP